MYDNKIAASLITLFITLIIFSDCRSIYKHNPEGLILKVTIPIGDVLVDNGKIRPNEILLQKHSVRTMKGSSAEMQFTDSELPISLRINENTTLSYWSENGIEIFYPIIELTNGNLLLKNVSKNITSNTIIRSPTIILTETENSTVKISVSSNGDTEIILLSGAVRIRFRLPEEYENLNQKIKEKIGIERVFEKILTEQSFLVFKNKKVIFKKKDMLTYNLSNESILNKPSLKRIISKTDITEQEIESAQKEIREYLNDR